MVIYIYMVTVHSHDRSPKHASTVIVKGRSTCRISSPRQTRWIFVRQFGKPFRNTQNIKRPKSEAHEKRKIDRWWTIMGSTFCARDVNLQMCRSFEVLQSFQWVIQIPILDSIYQTQIFPWSQVIDLHQVLQMSFWHRGWRSSQERVINGIDDKL